MMELIFHIKYRAEWGQTLCVCGSIPELGCNEEEQAFELRATGVDEWEGRISPSISLGEIKVSYCYLLKDRDGHVLRREWRSVRNLCLNIKEREINLYDSWIDRPNNSELCTSAFYDVFYVHNTSPKQEVFTESKNTLFFRAYAPIVPKDQRLYLSGSSDFLGGWSVENAIPLDYEGRGWWSCSCSTDHIIDRSECFLFKFFITSEERADIVWEKLSEDRFFRFPTQGTQSVIVLSSLVLKREDGYTPRFAGMSVPIFSLRSEYDLGVGDFGSLIEAIDWASIQGLKVIQILPINDTTFYRDWRDSYPYNAISVEALHPIYLDINTLPPLSDSSLQESLEAKGRKLSESRTVRYPEVARLKEEYLLAHYDEYGSETLKEVDFQTYYEENKIWLDSYAVYCFLRDSHPGKTFHHWGEYAEYDEEKVQALLSDERYRLGIQFYVYTQYLLHKQLTSVRQYAEKKGILLKGDIPIGVAPHSCDAWFRSDFFHLDRSAGAPPDAFSEDGQNWGFPTYNWVRMLEDDMEWWRHRFERISHYFKAVRVDHVLGFFRIWEIPCRQESGLLGHFSPAIPLSLEELKCHLGGIRIDELCRPCVSREDAIELFGDVLDSLVSSRWLIPEGEQYYLHECSQKSYDQIEVESIAGGIDTLKKLKSLCCEVALLEDPYKPGYYHPRIFFEKSLRYSRWPRDLQNDWNKMSWHYFYSRHNELYKQTALQRLRLLMNSTDMLFCAEDLGMIPATVPEVLGELRMLSLELERMPKQESLYGWVTPHQFPYLSVCTTSTHDMPPLRLWWSELSKEQRELYIREELKLDDTQPDEDRSIFYSIVEKHLESPSMLAILPIADWMSVDPKLHLQAPQEEQINHPENPNQRWEYRLPYRFVDLSKIAPDWNNSIEELLEKSGRR